MAGKKDPRVDAYLTKTKWWPEESRALRAICLETPLTEDLKWNQPCYTFDGGNVVIVSEFKDYCALGFFKGSLLEDKKKLLKQPGEYQRAMRHLRYTSVEDVEKNKSVITSYIDEAIELEKSGAKVDFSENRELPIPAELIARFEASPDFQTAFDNLTPGRQRGYLLYFADAKKSETRASRIEKYADRIMDGHGLRD